MSQPFRRRVLFVTSVVAVSLTLQAPIALHAETAPPCVAPTVSTAAPADAAPATEVTAAPAVIPVTEAPPAAEVAAQNIQLMFSEILPDPAGKDIDGEFIEIAVTGGGTTEGWSIIDAHERTFHLPAAPTTDGFIIFAYSATKIPLPNDGGSLFLKGPDGTVRDRLDYASPVKEGSAYARTAEGGWSWTTTPTPATANTFPVAAPPPPASSGSAVSAAPPPVVSTTASASGTPAATPVPAAPPPKLRLSELLPNPIGDDAAEWIEIINDETAEIALAGWSLADRSGDRFIFTNEKIPGGGAITIMKSVDKLSLNNDGDTVSLLAPDGTIIDTTMFAMASEGKSWARVGDTWKWTDPPTPGQRQNLEIMAVNEQNNVDAADPETTVSAAATTSGETPPTPADLDELPEIEEGTPVEITGTVSVAPGGIGKRIFAIQDDDAGAFIRVRGAKTFSVAVGDVVSVRGKSSRRGHEENVSTVADGIKKIGRKKIAAVERDIGAIEPADAGRIIALEGKISHRTKRTLFLADDGGRTELRVALPAQGVPQTEPGSGARVTGLVRFTKDTPEIIVFDRAGIALTAPPAMTKHESPTAEPQTLVLSSNEQRSTNALGAAAIVGAASSACIAAYVQRRKKNPEISAETT
ncbi:lamin tail domain-containing protein [Candidatus Uhrbacteria bacterium]|nr:lamin tail domain-containing protein [Candidatus Uhrbacteria bacterium]